jgi:hypothetical protein
VRNNSHEAGLNRNVSNESLRSLSKLKRSGSPNALVRSNSGMSANTLSDHSDHADHAVTAVAPDKQLARSDLVRSRALTCPVSSLLLLSDFL